MTLLVVDASVAAAFSIASQRTERSAQLLKSWIQYQATAPYVFQLEVPWLLVRQERRTSDRGFARQRLAEVAELAIRFEPAPGEAELQQAFDLADRHDLGLYDAHYLLLAIDTHAVLATRDNGLVQAAGLFGVDVMDVR